MESIDNLTPQLLAKIEAIAQSEPILARRLISEDSKTTGINVTLQLPLDDQIALTTAVEYAEAMAARLEAEIPHLTVAITGRSPLSNSFPRASIKDMTLLMPLMFGIIVIALVGFLRSFWGTAATLFVIILSVISAMGAAGFMGVKPDRHLRCRILHCIRGVGRYLQPRIFGPSRGFRHLAADPARRGACQRHHGCYETPQQIHAWGYGQLVPPA